MREILFRGKCEDTGNWICGHFFTLGKRGYIIKGEEIKPIDINTLGQYTGYVDEDECAIFEGDILHRECHWGVRVVFEEGGFILLDEDSVRLVNRCCERPISTFHVENWKIAGSIYD